jgi:hypothetical protein
MDKHVFLQACALKDRQTDRQREREREKERDNVFAKKLRALYILSLIQSTMRQAPVHAAVLLQIELLLDMQNKKSVSTRRCPYRAFGRHLRVQLIGRLVVSQMCKCHIESNSKK